MTTQPDPPTFGPSSPDPAMVHQIFLLLRYALMGLATLGIGAAWKLSDTTLMAVAYSLAGILGCLVAIGSAWYAQIQAKKRAHAAAVQSSTVGRPVAPT